MPYLGPNTTIVVALLLLSGCRLPGSEGPVPKSLADCRQLSQRGIAAAERGQHEQAETLLSDAVKACPVDPDARRHYAEALWHRGARPQAVAQLQEAVRLANDPMLRVRLAEMQLALGQMEPARQTAEAALDLNPRLSAAWAIRGRVMRAAGQLPQALADYHRCLAYAPDDRQVLLEIAQLYRQLGQPQRALAALHRLVDTYSPGEEPQQVLYLLGLTYIALDRYDDGVDSLSAAVLRKNPSPDVYYHLAEAEMLAGRPAQAAAAAWDALELQPGHLPSRDLLARLQTTGQPEEVRRPEVEAPPRR